MLTIGIIITLFLSALFSGTEIAFVSASKLRVALKSKSGGRRGAILARFFEKPGAFLSTMLVGNNIALVLFAYLMERLLSPVIGIPEGPLLLFVNTILITVVILIFGEFLPKTFFRLFADRLLFFLAYPLAFLRLLLHIPSFVMTSLTNAILSIFVKQPVKKADDAFTRLDLENFVERTIARTDEEIDTDLFRKALHLNTLKVKECMVPRSEIEHIDKSATIEALKQKFIETKMSKIVVIKEDLDHILGFVHHRQLLKEPGSWQNLNITEMPIVPEAMSSSDLLRSFMNEKNNIAWVVDEFGGTAGIITLEDILEELFGEIEDEHDQEEYVETVVSENEYVFSGRIELDYISEKYGLRFPKGDYHTLSGYLVMTLETIPEQGSDAILEDYQFIFEVVSDTRIELIRIKKQHNNESTSE